MRTRSILTLAVCSAAGILLTGCGMGPLSGTSASTGGPLVANNFQGKIYGGQQPISGAYVGLFAAGNTGYGSASTLLESTTTGSDGSYTISAFSCNGNAPLYILAIAGNPGGGSNMYSVLGAGLGTCGGTMNTAGGVVINEVTTVALGFSLSHYFSTSGTSIDGITDTFGGPGNSAGSTKTYSLGLTNSNQNTIPMLVNLATGAPQATASSTNATTGVVTTANIDTTKLNTLASALAQCVNADVSMTPNACTSFFGDANSSGNSSTPPTDTLQAIIQIALAPTHNVAAIINDVPAQPVFTPVYTAANPPNDFAVGVSYSSTAFGLNVAPGQVSTIDVDRSGRVWFPSNVKGVAGIAYFDPALYASAGAATAFSTLYDTGVTDPTQVAIDGNNNNIWVNDLGADVLTNELVSSPSKAAYESYPATAPLTSVAVNYDATVRVGSSSGSGSYSVLSGDPTVASGTALTTVYPTNNQQPLPYPVVSLAGDPANDDGASMNNATSYLEGDVLEYETGANVSPYTDSPIIQSGNPGAAGEIVYTTANANGGNYIQARASNASLGGSAPDGLCIFVLSQCYAFANSTYIDSKGNTVYNVINYGTYGMALDGSGLLWLSASGGYGVLSTAGSYTSSSTVNTVLPYTAILRKTGSKIMPAPFGIAIDSSGNVWVSNATSTSASSTTTGFTLTELVGLATPTVTPLAAQTALGSTRTGKMPQY